MSDWNLIVEREDGMRIATFNRPLGLVFDTEDRVEGVVAFLEKRKAEWKGR